MTIKNSTSELYLIRHAETVMNTNPHLVGGRSNETPLTEKGILQAKRLGVAMLARQIIPVSVYASPALRAIESARHSLRSMEIDTEPIIQDAIQELSQGPTEGTPRVEVYTEEILRNINMQGKDFKLEGGESMNDVGIRMHDWIIEEIPLETKRYFVFTHGGAIKYLASHILGWSHQQTYETEIDNTSVNLFTITNGVLGVAYLNRDAEQV